MIISSSSFKDSKISFSILFLPTINLVLSERRKCLPIFNSSTSFISGGVSLLWSYRSRTLLEKAGSVNKQPPAAFGGSAISYFFANCS